MVQIWTYMDRQIKKFLRPPSRRETLADYMRQLEESKAAFIAYALDHYPDVKRKVTPEAKALQPSPPSYTPYF